MSSNSLFVSAETIVNYYCWLVWCERKILFWLIIHDRLRPSEQTDVYTSDSDGVLGGHKGLYWFGRNVSTSSSLLLVLPALGLQ